jgi:UDP-N-acetylmuramoyl-tripeptide--D-alanyl-D-alanine ligase
MQENAIPVNVYIPVNDTNQALLDLAREYAAKFRIPKIAVTGSNGKTTTKDMITRVLATAGPTLSTQGNFNNQVGVPLTLFELKSRHRYAVIEMGTNHPGEIAPLSVCARPSIAVVTNIGYSHLEHFGSKEKIRDEKLTITAGFGSPKGILILNVDDPLLAEVKANTRQKLVTFGIDRGQIRPADLAFNDDGCASFRIGRTRFQLQVPGRHNVYNALAAIAVGVQLRIPKSEIASALRAFTASKNRLQLKKLPGLTVLDDCYNANPSSMRSALTTLGGMRAAGHRVAVLGDMLELGPEGEALHTEMGRYLVEMGVDELFTFGQLSRHINSGAREKGLPGASFFRFRSDGGGVAEAHLAWGRRFGEGFPRDEAGTRIRIPAGEGQGRHPAYGRKGLRRQGGKPSESSGYETFAYRHLSAARRAGPGRDGHRHHLFGRLRAIPRPAGFLLPGKPYQEGHHRFRGFPHRSLGAL